MRKNSGDDMGDKNLGLGLKKFHFAFGSIPHTLLSGVCQTNPQNCLHPITFVVTITLSRKILRRVKIQKNSLM